MRSDVRAGHTARNVGVCTNSDGVTMMKRLPVLAFMAFSAVGVLAAEQLCPAPAPGQEQVAPKQGEQCPTPPEQCQKKQDVSWFDWALGSHQMPSLHFVDFLELFVR
jgi:hypothetical protein